MKVYKLYPARWALEALDRRRLKVTTLADINDPFEFAAIAAKNKRERIALQHAKLGLMDGKGLISFSKIWSSPLLWSHYADNHRGIALGFDVNDDDVVEVSYDKERPKLSDYQSEDGSLAPSIAPKMFKTKAVDWQYEQEVRMFVSLQDRDRVSGLYFFDFNESMKLTDVILGSEYQGNGLGEWQKDLETADVQFTTARTAFKSFTIVEQKNKRFWKEL